MVKIFKNTIERISIGGRRTSRFPHGTIYNRPYIIHDSDNRKKNNTRLRNTLIICGPE